MRSLRRALVIFLVLVAGVFPTSAYAWFGESIWNGAKETIGDLLDAGEGVLEVGFEGVYGAGCGVKNLVTWNGNSCSTSVSDAGNEFRSVISGIDDCILNADPTGITGFGAASTVPDGMELPEYGLSESEVNSLVATVSESGSAGSTAMSAYLASRGGRAAVAASPVWQRVVRGLPVAKYALLVTSLAMTCGDALDFAVTGVDFLVNGNEVWRQEDGIWMHCTTLCRPDPELNYPGCEPIMVGGGHLGPVEMHCYPGTGQPIEDTRSYDERLRGSICGSVISSADSDFDYDEYCDERMEDEAAACRAGTSTRTADVCTQITGSTSVQTITPQGTPGSVNTGNLDAGSVPGGSVDGSCAQVIRNIASSGTVSPYSPSTVSQCVGTSIASCQVVRAKAAAGYAVFPLPADVQTRCFG